MRDVSRTENVLRGIQEATATGRYLVTLHAFRQTEERHIALLEIEEAVLSDEAEVIEDYPDDRRGPSCLVLGVTKGGRIIHVQVSYPPTVWVITAYEPNDEKWLDPRTRR
jgi:hypothetical protein